jgi:hypothetical protein
MHIMSGLSLALHWHLCIWLIQVHGSQCGTVFPVYVHQFYQHSLGCSILIWYWILRISGFLELLCCIY